MLLEMDVGPGCFYEIHPGSFFIPNTELTAGTELRLEELLDLDGNVLFSIFDVHVNGNLVGSLLHTNYEVRNMGSVLLATNAGGVGGDEGDLAMRSQDLVVYTYQSKHTLAICPRLNDNLKMLLEDQ